MHNYSYKIIEAINYKNALHDTCCVKLIFTWEMERCSQEDLNTQLMLTYSIQLHKHHSFVNCEYYNVCNNLSAVQAENSSQTSGFNVCVITKLAERES
jgi:hypothetical protein